MKKKIPTDILLQIEDRIKEYRETGIFNYTHIANFKNNYTIDTDTVAKAIDLAHIMPFEEMQNAIEMYDQSTPKMDELKFVVDLAHKYNVKRGDVIERIQHVRRILKRRREETEQHDT